MASTTVPYKLPDGRLAIDVNTNKTLAATDQGIIQNVIADATITLPSTSNGLNFTVRNGGLPVTNGPAGAVSDASVSITLAPQAADAIAGLGFTATVNKGAQNLKTAPSRVGDEMSVAGTGTAGVTAWQINSEKLVGTWTRVP